jgi:hypothetical protein
MSDTNADHPERLQDILARMGERFFTSPKEGEKGSGHFRVHAEHGMSTIILSTGSCRV